MARLPGPALVADAAQAERGRARFLEAIAEDAARREAGHALLAAEPWGPLLDAVFGFSPFLTQSLILEPQLALDLPARGFDESFAAIRAELAALDACAPDTAALAARLRLIKRRAALIVALADIAGAWNLETATLALSDLADGAIDAAAAHLLAKLARDGKLDLDPDEPLRESGLIILGLGKLGARELNYSSDVDLMVLYDDEIVRMHDRSEMSSVFVRLARDLVRLLEHRTAEGYVFRTDLRLRPDPGATPLAVSVAAAESYYGSIGQNWERAAMIRARPVAGDAAAGERFIKLLRPWIWRRSMDFAAIQDVQSIKRQIFAHKGNATTAVNGHNVKLGRGGIREIEFFAQTQQLIFGGRYPQLRSPRTMEALLALAVAGRIEAQTQEDLSDCYRYLRTVEHRLQMKDDRQTHSLPNSDEEIEALARFMGYDNAAPFRADVLKTLNRVQAEAADLFEESKPLAAEGRGNLVFTGTEDDPDTLRTLESFGFTNPKGVADTIRGWHHSRYRATRSERARELLTALMPDLLGAFGKTPNPDETFARFHDFLSRLPAGVQIFSLLQQNPRLLEQVAELLSMAPEVAQFFSQNPSVLDSFLTEDFFGPFPARPILEADLERFLAHADSLEEALDLVRRWAREKRFQADVQILQGQSDADIAGPFLTDIAELSLAALMPRVEAAFAERHGRFADGGFAVIAFGRLGSRQLTSASDLDLVTVYDPAGEAASNGEKPLDAATYFMRLTQRLVSAVTAPTAEGRLYEIDLRLRPQGEKGPLATGFDSWRRYYTESAWTWELMALTRARVILGPPRLRAAIESAVRTVLAGPRDETKLLHDVADMRARVDQTHGTTDVWKLKYVRGGLMDVDFIAQYLMLKHAPARADVLSTNMAASLERLATAGALSAADAATLIEALRLFRRVQGLTRLAARGDKFDPAQATPGLKRALCRAVLGAETDGIDFAATETTLREVQARVAALYETIIAAPARALPTASISSTAPFTQPPESD
jgi:glutamate-ammonia-ligase adenylyltransferase